jgi:hypothetical protein
MSSDDAPRQSTFASVDEASSRWRDEGVRYKRAVNDYVRRIYEVGYEAAGEEPKETREDMADYVLSQIESFNARGDFASLREKFPPAYEPFGSKYEELSRSVEDVFLIGGGRVACRVGDALDSRNAYVIDGHEITELPGVLALGSSPYRRYFARAYEDRVDVHRGFDGPVVHTFGYPRSLPESLGDVPLSRYDGASDLHVERLAVFPSGDSVLLTSTAGVWVLSAEGAELVHPDPDVLEQELAERVDDLDDGEVFGIELSYAHGAVSPDGAYLAVGDQDSAHRVLHRVDGRWVEAAVIDPRSSYPCMAFFHDARPHLALSSCHALYGSATVGVDLGRLPSFRASGHDGDDTLDYVDDRHWVFSAAPLKNGYLLGANNGYLWAKAFDEDRQLWYLHLGSTVTAIDISEDRDEIVVGTHAGYLIRLEIGRGRDPLLVTDHDVREVARYCFFHGRPPLVW